MYIYIYSKYIYIYYDHMRTKNRTFKSVLTQINFCLGTPILAHCANIPC